MREEREKWNKKILKSFSISIRTVLFLELYCLSMLKLLAFRTCDVGGFLVFGVPNAKYLTFGTPDASALIRVLSSGMLNAKFFTFGTPNTKYPQSPNVPNAK